MVPVVQAKGVRTVSEENKPCPFCGNKEFSGEKRIQLISYEGFRNPKYIVNCFKCEASGPVCKTPEEAWEKWNKRIDRGKNE